MTTTQHYPAALAVLNQVAVIGSLLACDYPFVGAINSNTDYFLDDPSKAKPGDLSQTNAGNL